MTVKDIPQKIAPFYLADFLIEPELNSISHNGTRYKIEPKIMQVLLCLSQHPSEVISKDYLLDTVWADTIVVDMVLTRAISELRSVFKDKPKQPQFIETIPKKGYRLIATVNPPKTQQAPIEKTPIKFKKQNQYFLPLLVLASITLVLLSFFYQSTTTTAPIEEVVSSQHLTTLKGWEYQPALSLDGQKIAYIHQPQGSQFSQLLVQSMQTQKHIPLTNENEGQFFRPAWSPDGQRLAFYGYIEGQLAIFLTSASGGERLLLLTLQANMIGGLSWSPDGQQLVYVDKDSLTNQHEIYCYQFTSKTSKKLGDFAPEGLGDLTPKYSLDGKSVVFVRTIAEGNQDLYQYHISTQKLQRLTEFNKNILGFDWKEKNQLLIASDIVGKSSLFILDLPTKLPLQPTQLIAVNQTTNLQNPIVTQNGIISEQWQTDVDLVLYDLVDSVFNASPKLSSTQWELHPAFSKDGKQITYVSNKSGHYEIWTSNQNGSNAQQLTRLKKGFPSKPQWSPDGQKIIFESNHTGQHQLYFIDTQLGGEPIVFTKGAPHINPIFSADGHYIYCSIQTDNKWDSWRISLLEQTKEQLTFDGVYHAKPDATNHWLYYVKFNQNGLWKKDLSTMGTKDTLLIKDLAWADWCNWTLQESGIHYVKRLTNGSTTIHFFDFKTNTTQKVVSLPKNMPYYDPALAITENGTQLIIGQVNSYDSDLIITTIH